MHFRSVLNKLGMQKRGIVSFILFSNDLSCKICNLTFSVYRQACLYRNMKTVAFLFLSSIFLWLLERIIFICETLTHHSLEWDTLWKRFGNVMQTLFLNILIGDNMVNARCLKCKKQVEMVEPVESLTKNNLRIIKGKCPDCETTVCRILGKKKEEDNEVLPQNG